MLIIEPACKSERQFVSRVAVSDDIAVAVVFDLMQDVSGAAGDDARATELVGENVVTLVACIVRGRCVTYRIFVAVFEVVVTVERGQQAGFVFPEVFFHHDTVNQFGNAITKGVMAIGNRVLWCRDAQQAAIAAIVVGGDDRVAINDVTRTGIQTSVSVVAIAGVAVGFDYFSGGLTNEAR